MRTAPRGLPPPRAGRALHAPRDVSVDLSELRFADPSLMLDLAVLAQRLRAEAGRSACAAPQPQVRTLIELVGLDRARRRARAACAGVT